MQSRNVPILLGGLLGLLAIGAGFWLGTGQVEDWQFAARYTARVGFPLFLLTYAASSLVRLWPGDSTRALLRHRRQWGLGFALAHSIHLVALIVYLTLSGESRPIGVLIGGGTAYALMFAMALTSNDAAMRAMGIWWKRLHRTGIHVLWGVFAFSYFGRLFSENQQVTGLVFFPLCVASLGLRIMAWRKRS